MTASIHLLTEAASQSLEGFLVAVERRAYRTALATTRRQADALDIVQEAMTKLVASYRERDASEWPMLFQRILQNAIMDWHREQSRHSRWFWQKGKPATDDEEDELAPEDEVQGGLSDNPMVVLSLARDMETVMKVLEGLPLRQRQAFLLRAWEGFDTRATAEAMAVTEGSVKTHYFRALQQLKTALSAQTEFAGSPL